MRCTVLAVGRLRPPYADDVEHYAKLLSRYVALDLVFTVGGPYGTPLGRRPDLRLSLGPMTLPHLLARVVLLEQLYRAHKILAGEPYHH